MTTATISDYGRYVQLSDEQAQVLNKVGQFYDHMNGRCVEWCLWCEDQKVRPENNDLVSEMGKVSGQAWNDCLDILQSGPIRRDDDGGISTKA